MRQLIEIQIVPGQFEIRRTDPKIEYTNAKVDMSIKRNEGAGMKIQTKPVKVNIDSYAARSSLGPHGQSVSDNIKSYASKGNSAAQNSTATYANRGQQLLKTQRGEELITRFAKQDTFKNVKMNIGLDFLPKVAPDITVDSGDITMQFELDKLEFDWKMTEQQLHFTPGTITLEMVQRPDVIVRYVGGPSYFPQSANG